MAAVRAVTLIVVREGRNNYSNMEYYWKDTCLINMVLNRKSKFQSLVQYQSFLILNCSIKLGMCVMVIAVLLA